jgi:hypothetical protein
MSFNSSRVNPYATGALVAFTAPLAAYKGSVIALSGVATNAVASSAGLVLPVGGANNVEFESLGALVETNITTTNCDALTKWQVTFDGTNWIDYLDHNCIVGIQKSANGTGSLVTTQYYQAFDGVNPAFMSVRLAVKNVGAATGAAGDNVTVGYTWRRRFIAAMG